MGFPFVYVCDLLDKLEAIHIRDVALLPKDRTSRTHDGIVSWFRTHKWRINANDTDDMAVLMMLKPEKQTDRDYGLGAALEQTLGRIFKLSTVRYEHLKSWRDDAHNQGDLGSRLCKILENIGFAPFRSDANKIMVEQIDQALLRIAVFSDKSSPSVKSLKQAGEQAPDRIEVLESLYMQLQPREAKWLTRIIQKNYGPVTLPNDFGIAGKYTGLPNCLQVNMELLSSGSVIVRRDGYAVRKGVGSSEPSHPLPTPPTSSPSAPVEGSVAVAAQPPRRYLLTLDPTSLTLVPQVKISGPPTLAKSSTNPSSSVTKSTTAANLHLPSAPAKFSPLPFLSVTEITRTDEVKYPPPAAKSSPLPSSTINSIMEISKARSQRSPSTVHSATSSVGSSQHNQITAPRRTALGTISSNIPSGRSQGSQQKSQENDVTPLPRSILQNPMPPPVIFSTGKCAHTTSNTAKRCRFSNTLLILSPCLLRTPYILETLIPSHGAHYVVSLSTLSHPTVPRRTKSGKRIRKFILVEVNHPEKTVQFCKAAERGVRRLGWKCDRGVEERIPIFDWRVLESFRKIDNGEELGYEPVRKHFQGAI